MENGHETDLPITRTDRYRRSCSDPPLAFPAPAKADPTREDVWDRVALCESGDNWRANTGNGYYGGLQFSRLTWNSFGGGAYAGTANYATRWQQITIAEKMVRAQGWGAWPTCSVKAGVR